MWRKTQFFQCYAPTSAVRTSFHFQSNYCSKHKSSRHGDAAPPPRWHLSGADNRLKCFRAEKTRRNAKASTHRSRQLSTHELSRPLGRAVWVKNREWEWWSSCSRLLVGWALRRAARGSGGLGDGGGLQGDPEQGAACLIGAHLHSSGAGDTWRAFPAL